MYNFTFHLTEGEYFGFTKFHAMEQLSSPSKGIWVLKITVLIFIGLVLLFPMLLLGQVRIPELIFFCIIVIFLTIGQKYFTLFIVRMQIRAIKKMGRLPYNLDIQLIFDEEHFTEITHVTKTQTKYSILEKVDDGHDAVYVRIGAVQAAIIPHTAFESEEQKRDFIAFINTKIPPKV